MNSNKKSNNKDPEDGAAFGKPRGSLNPLHFTIDNIAQQSLGVVRAGEVPNDVVGEQTLKRLGNPRDKENQMAKKSLQYSQVHALDQAQQYDGHVGNERDNRAAWKGNLTAAAKK